MEYYYIQKNNKKFRRLYFEEYHVKFKWLITLDGELSKKMSNLIYHNKLYYMNMTYKSCSIKRLKRVIENIFWELSGIYLTWQI